MIDFYKAIWLATWRQQIPLILLSIIVAALAAAPLDFQKEAINGLVAGEDGDKLLMLCAGYLGIILLSAALKFLLNFRISALGEAVIRLIRERLYARYVEDTVAEAGQISTKGTLVTMISAEAEDVGAFSGAAIAEPLVTIGTLCSVIGYITATEPALGMIALGMILPQAVIVLAIQRQINIRVRKRVQHLRSTSDTISASAMKQLEQEVQDDFDAIYNTRRQIFFWKLSSKFVLKTITAFGTVGVLLLGGLMVLEGRTEVGVIVAALTGLTQISGPWLELVAFFRNASTMQVRFHMIIEKVYPRDGPRRREGRVRM